jgi:hypothetical protein
MARHPLSMNDNGARAHRTGAWWNLPNFALLR